MASPMYLSTKPPCASMMSVMAERYSFIAATSSAGAIFSANEEKSAMSEKYTVTLRISPPSAGGLFDAIIFSITAGAR